MPLHPLGWELGLEALLSEWGMKQGTREPERTGRGLCVGFPPWEQDGSQRVMALSSFPPSKSPANLSLCRKGKLVGEGFWEM